MFDKLLKAAPYAISSAEKENLLLEGLNELTQHHYVRCAEYRRIVDVMWNGLRSFETLEDVPYIPVGLFKELDLVSTATPSIVLHSSGTTGQVPSRIQLDPDTADRQARALVQTFIPILGRNRLPFLVIDARSSILNQRTLSARGAGVLGMMKFGTATTFCLDSSMTLDVAAVRNFVQRHGTSRFLIFGFTFLVWTKLYDAFYDGELDLSKAVLIHSGGWKRMEDQKVSNETFRTAMRRRFNLAEIYNFYGFVEQIGSVFIEGEDGLLYAPNFADVIVRRPDTWEPAGLGEEGVIQVVSLLPTSYPGHSVLTEDWGYVAAVDTGVGGRLGKGIRVLGRIPKSELRGCSDVIAA